MKLIYIVIWSIMPINACAQSIETDHKPPIPLEIFTGNRSIYYQQVMSKDLFGGGYNFFNVTNFDAQSSQGLTQNSFLISSFFSKKLGRGFSVGLGGEIQKPGAFFIVGGQYTYANDQFLLVLFPSVNLNGESALSHLSLLEFKPRISKTISVYSRIQFLVVTDFKAVGRSYQQARLGLQIQNFQFGLAMNLDQFDDFQIKLQNFGIFLRVLIF